MSFTITLKSGRQIYCHRYRTVEHGICYQQKEDSVPELYISAEYVREIYPETQTERELWQKFCDWHNDMPYQIRADGDCDFDRMQERIREIMRSNISRSEMIMQLTAIRVKCQSDEIEAMPKELDRVIDKNKNLERENAQLKSNNISLQNRLLNGLNKPKNEHNCAKRTTIIVLIISSINMLAYIAANVYLLVSKHKL